MEEEKKEEEKKQSEIADKLKRFDKYQGEINNFEALQLEKENYRRLCEEMYVNGIIKQNPDGSFVAVEDMAERESIKSKCKMTAQSQNDPPTPRNEFNSTILNDDLDKMEDMG